MHSPTPTEFVVVIGAPGTGAERLACSECREVIGVSPDAASLAACLGAHPVCLDCVVTGAVTEPAEAIVVLPAVGPVHGLPAIVEPSVFGTITP